MEKYLQRKEHLDQREMERFNEFYFEQDKIAFSFRRYCLKKLLSEYLGIELPGVKIKLSKYEKPVLEDRYRSLKFSISHSDEFVLYAFSRAYEIGADIECCENKMNFMGVASRFFSEDEYEFLRETETENKLEAFYNIWTCKEAFLKYSGTGLYKKLSAFSLFALEENLLSFKLMDSRRKTFLGAVCTHYKNPKIEHFSIRDTLNI